MPKCCAPFCYNSTYNKKNTGITFHRFKRQPDEYDPHLHRNLPHPTNNLETMMHLLKASLGTGILAMPQAFSHVGLLMGCIATVVIGIILTHCLHVLIRSEYEASKRKRVPIVTYREAMVSLLKAGPKYLRPFAGCLAICADVFLIVYQLGICCIYILFLAENIKKLVDPHFQMSIQIYMVIVLFPLILLNLIPNLKKLSPVSAISNISVVIGVIIIIYIMIVHQKSSDTVTRWGTLSRYPLFFGTTMFALTSVGVVVSAENNMKSPKDFIKPLGILNLSMVFVVLLYMLVGALGYTYCVSECSDSITLDLPEGDLSIVVMALYVIAVFTSYALHCYVPVEIIWRDYVLPRLEKKNASNTRKNVTNYVLRIGLCIMTFFITLGVPRLGLFISLFGALCLSALAISFPVLMEICSYYPNKYGTCRIRLIKDIFLFIVGIIGLVAGTYTAIYGIIVSFM